MTKTKHVSPDEGIPNTVTCPMCGKEFYCGLSRLCWCATMPLSDEVRAWLAARYETCVCRTCLERLIENGVKE
ncbi:MAG TPA: cysteine-rich CWC family protein [Chlorobaculum sp.]|jgi:hypothetical protein|nr:cysteine-rich CWC family protein [Chlorobaculum sp.]